MLRDLALWHYYCRRRQFYLLNQKRKINMELTPQEALKLLKEGKEVMVKPYDDDYENFTGIVIEDFDDDTDDEILSYLTEKEEIELW